MRTKQWGVPRILQGLVLLALGGCAATSRPPSQDDAVDEGALFEIIDRDRNGAVTEEEFVRVYEDRAGARREFERLDTNRDRGEGRSSAVRDGCTALPRRLAPRTTRKGPAGIARRY